MRLRKLPPYEKPSWCSSDGAALVEEVFQAGIGRRRDEISAHMEACAPLTPDDIFALNLVKYSWKFFSLKILWAMRLAYATALQSTPADLSISEVEKFERLLATSTC